MTATGPRIVSGSVVIISRVREFSISDEDHPAARRRDRAGADAGRDDVGCARAAVHDIIGQIHHLAETVVHHRKPPVRAEHAQAVRHVVQSRIELTGQRRLALPGDPGVQVDALEAGCEPLDRDEENEAQKRKRDVIGPADVHQRHEQGSAGKQYLDVKNSRPAECATDAAGRACHDRRGAEHMGGGIVGPQQDSDGPNADRDPVGDCTPLVPLFPNRGFVHRQLRFPLLVAIHLKRARQAHDHEERHAEPAHEVAGDACNHGTRDRGTQRAEDHRHGVDEQRIHHRRVNRRRHLLLIEVSGRICKLHRVGARPVRCVVLPIADEAFLREHRYRSIAFFAARRKSAR